MAWTSVLYKHFPQTPCKTSEPSLSPLQLLLVVGNNDFPVDGIVPPARSEWSQFLWDLWKDALPKDAETQEVSTGARRLPEREAVWFLRLRRQGPCCWDCVQDAVLC